MKATTNLHHKVNASHLARKAIVYLRQSSPGQVRDNVESQRLQYAMVDRARELGWTQIEVIDTDLGHSASVGAPRREGFERLVAQVTLGEVGIIFSYEVSRLSRNDRDWCQLFEICPLLDTLVADDQHIYDLNISDDQLILGIKGTISVMELRTLKARLLAGQEEKARRGELVRVLAPGYVKDETGKVVKDPNQRVQQAMLLVFERFRAIGTIRQTFKWFQDEKVELPVNQFRGGKCVLTWQLPTHSFISDVLKNAIYAGVYLYGRRSTETMVRDGRPVRRVGAYRAPSDCRVFLRDHHEGYIDWETFQHNQQIMEANNVKGEPDEAVGAVRSGYGLLTGLLRCRRCGRKLHVRYRGRRGTSGRYLCHGDYQSGGSYCIGFGQRGVDKRFAQEVLEVISPLGIAAGLEAAQQLASKGEARRGAVARQLQQVAYEERRAREQFDHVDARNRLVASELERRWNEKLEQVEALQRELTELDEQYRLPTDSERAKLRELGERFADVWHSVHCPQQLRKRIVRSVVEEVVVNLDDRTQMLTFVIHWKGGVHTEFEMLKPPSAAQQKTSQDDLEIIRALAVRYGDDVIAGVLGRQGRRTGKGRPWSTQSVRTARRNHGIPGQRQTRSDPEILSLEQAYRYCAVSDMTIKRLIASGLVQARQIVPCAPWEIRKSDLDSAPVRETLKTLRETGKLVLPRREGGTANCQLPLPLSFRGLDNGGHHA